MYAFQLSEIIIILCLSTHILIIFASTTPESIAISCGSSTNRAIIDQRPWIGDHGFESSSPLTIKGKPSKAKTISKSNAKDSTPYETARISHHEFSYAFQVKPGQKFIRLHFHHVSYQGFERSKALFTVKTGPYTLLRFPTSAQTTQIKEYSLNIEEDQQLTITFSPAQPTKKSDNFYAFINGIEILSMPNGLYFTPEGDLGPPVVGQKNRVCIDKSTAMEMVQRFNVGGISISPADDSGLFRRWDEDTAYLSERGDVPANIFIVRFSGTQSYVAPVKVYKTARSVASDLTWKIPVDLGFRYLVRIHFSDFQPNEFSIIINNIMIVENNSDGIQMGGESQEAVYKDYVIMIEGDKMVGNRNLTIGFHPKFESTDEQLLNGLEVFKLSNHDNNLAGKEISDKLSSKSAPRKQLFDSASNVIGTVLTIVLALLNIVVYHLRKKASSNSRMKKFRLSKEYQCRQFYSDEIRFATNNFHPQRRIGRGGYGPVFKGSIDGGHTVVAIKRLRSGSSQGDKEFGTEIEMLSKIRHKHLVSLIGYCDEGEERALIYLYMTRGTLADHLHKDNSYKLTPLSWGLRLKISIGAARGLYYLHSRHNVIHRDVKSTNILLDENWVAKISDFGLSKMGPDEAFTHISTNVKGTAGYLDPEYALTHRLTKKSDVYAFGVVLFELLTGRPAINRNRRNDDEHHSLAGWARYCITEERVEQLIDEHLKDQIAPACLKIFVGIAGRCLHIQPQGRPSMADVAMGLKLALALQQNPNIEDEENAGTTYSFKSYGVVGMDDISVTSIEGESHRITGEDIPLTTAKTKEGNSNSNPPSKSWWDPFGVLARIPSKPKASPFPLLIRIRQFSLEEIQKATDNFHNSLIIGYGGSDNVYKGNIDGGHKAVAIRSSRSRDSAFCMANELQTKKELQMKYLPSQQNVALLIGYCKTESDMMLVYEYMANGTLRDQLHERSEDPLPWKDRLQICIGTAKGISYLHSTVKQTMLHRDLTSANIWLGDNWIPRVSNWGLSKKKGDNDAPTILKGKWGYLDSDFIRGGEVTEKSYVYSFGILLFEVLCTGIESHRWLDHDQVSLAQWIKTCMQNNLSDFIDPSLVGKRSMDSLKSFIETAGRCLLDSGSDRPTMADVVARLETALKLHEDAEGKKSSKRYTDLKKI